MDNRGEAYLWELAQEGATAANFATYADIVREKWLLRRLMTLCQTIQTQIFSPETLSLEEKIDFAETQIFNLRDTAETENTLLSAKSLLPQLFEQWDKISHSDFPGLSTGFEALDQLTLGLREAKLWILAARPSMGKSTLALNMAGHVAKTHPVLFFSLEMSTDELLGKWVSAERQVSTVALQKGNISDADWKHLMSLHEHDAINNLFFDELARLSLHDLRTKIRRFIRKHGRVGLVVIDYLQLMSISGYSGNQRVAEISEISRGLKAIAREFKIPILALSQLNRELERRAERRPMMADLRESGAIEQDADVILFIYRDEVYNPETLQRGVAEVIVAKNRNGQTGKAHLKFEGQYSLFKEDILLGYTS